MENRQFFSKIELFKGLSQEELALVKQSASEKIFKKGEKLFTQGSKRNAIFLVGEGKAVAQQADVCDRVGGLSFVKYNFARYCIFVCPQADFNLKVIFGGGWLGFPHSGKILVCR